MRVLIVHAEVHTLLLNAGFFSYMFFYTFYNTWVDAESKLTLIVGEDRALWPATQALFTEMKSSFFILAALHITTYYSHTYRQATWKTYLPPHATQELKESKDKPESETKASKGKKAPSASKSKKTK